MRSDLCEQGSSNFFVIFLLVGFWKLIKLWKELYDVCKNLSKRYDDSLNCL